MGQKQVSLDLSFAQEDSKDICHYSGRVLPLLPHPLPQQLLSTSQNLGVFLFCQNTLDTETDSVYL